MKKFTAGLTALLLSTTSLQSATLLPNGEQQFFDNSGNPAAAGRVYFYIPGTTTPKNTWKDPGQTLLNTNPVILDANGRAIIYGSGAYTELLQDANGNTIWNQLTSDTSSSSNLGWGATGGGTSNTQTVTVNAFSYVDGQTFYYVASTSNTGSMTLSVNGGTPLAVVKTTTSGTSFLSGGEVVAGNVIGVTYYATTGQLQLVTNNTQNYSGEVRTFATQTCPAGWLETNGAALSRTTYSSLYAAIQTIWGSGDGTTTFNIPNFQGRFLRGWDHGAGNDMTVINGVLAAGSTTVTGLSNTGLMYVGMGVSGPGIPSGTTVASILSSSAITLSAAPSITSISQTGTTTIASNFITGLSDTSNLYVGQSVTGAGIPTGSTIVAIPSSTSLYFSLTITGNTTAGSSTITGIPNTSILSVGQNIGGSYNSNSTIPPNTTIASIVNGTTITISKNAAVTATGGNLYLGASYSGTSTITFGGGTTALTFTGRAFASYEPDQFGQHDHTLYDPLHSHGPNAGSYLAGDSGTQFNTWAAGTAGSIYGNIATALSTSNTHVGNSREAGAETRPENYAVLYCIKN